MNAQELTGTAKTLVAGDKGLLAMDESNPTCNKRFARLGIPQTEEARRAYRELIVTTPGLGESISGAILYDETIRQQKNDGTPFIANRQRIASFFPTAHRFVFVASDRQRIASIGGRGNCCSRHSGARSLPFLRCLRPCR